MEFTLDHIVLRRTSENDSFPWEGRLVTLVQVAPDGNVRQAKTDGEKRALLNTARDVDLVLAAWPGEWSQDIFVVDDLRAARLALGLPRNGAAETPSSASTPVAGWPDRGASSQPRLWERLAQVETLPVEGQRQVADQYSPAVVALLRRRDLDPEVRARTIEDMQEWSAVSAIKAGSVSAAEVGRLLNRFPDSADLLIAALPKRSHGNTRRGSPTMRPRAYGLAKAPVSIWRASYCPWFSLASRCISRQAMELSGTSVCHWFGP